MDKDNDFTKMLFPFCMFAQTEDNNQQDEEADGIDFEQLFKSPFMLIEMLKKQFSVSNMFSSTNQSSQQVGLPNELLKKILKMDASVEDLEKLQNALDYFFELYENINK